MCLFTRSGVMQQCFASRSKRWPSFTAIVLMLTPGGTGSAVSYANNPRGNGGKAFQNQMFTEDDMDDYVNIKLPGVDLKA